MGVDWLRSTGGRLQILGNRAELNYQFSSVLQRAAELTLAARPDVSSDSAEDWQFAYQEHRLASLKAAAVDSGRMVQYVAGRPCVVRVAETHFPLLGLGLCEFVRLSCLPVWRSVFELC